jgi:hypothetical protein
MITEGSQQMPFWATLALFVEYVARETVERGLLLGSSGLPGSSDLLGKGLG